MPASGTVTALNTASTPDPTLTNNGSAAGANVTTTVTQEADVAVAVNGPAAVVNGTSVTYSLFVTNNGPNTATGVAAQLVFSGTGTPGAITVTNGSYKTSTKTAFFTISNSGSLADGTTASFTVRFTVPATGTVIATTSSTATTANGDPNALNNDGSATVS